MKLKQQTDAGFTLIELFVVVALISLLASVALIAYQTSRQKARDVRRLSDMTQLASAFELYFSHNKGYPSATSELVPGTLIMVLTAPQPPDGDCAVWTDFAGRSVADYSYYPSGTAYVLKVNGVNKTLYPDYYLTFCLGQKTGSFDPGVHYLTSKGIR